MKVTVAKAHENAFITPVEAFTYISHMLPHCMLPVCLAGCLIFGGVNIFYV